MPNKSNRKEPTDIAIQVFDKWASGNGVGFPVAMHPNRRLLMVAEIARLIRRERYVTFKLRDAAADAFAVVEQILDAAEGSQALAPSALPGLEKKLHFALMLARENTEREGVGSRLPEDLILLQVGTLNNGWWLHFDFQDDKRGQTFALTFDYPSEVLLDFKLDGATAAQLVAMMEFARAEFIRYKGA